VFHIKDDVRAQRSAQLMYAGLMKVLEKKKLSEATVTDVSHASTVGRATFYRNFDEVTDILWWRVNDEFARVLNNFMRTHATFDEPDELLTYLLRYWMRHSRDLEVLIDAGRLDVIYDCFVNNADVVVDYLKSLGKDIATDHPDYFVATRAGFFVAVFKTWLQNGKRESPEEVARIVAEQHEQIVRSGVLA
jgi:AcrR family transcriptional regulator